MRLLYIISVCGLLSGCALTDLNPFDKPQLEVNAAVGQNVKQEKAQVKLESGNQEAETISNDTTQTAKTIKNVTQNVPLEYMLLFALFAGWAIPDPSKCLSGASGVVTGVWNGVVVAPIRGVGEWLLRLFGR